jgi:hypothetical protein
LVTEREREKERMALHFEPKESLKHAYLVQRSQPKKASLEGASQNFSPFHKIKRFIILCTRSRNSFASYAMKQDFTLLFKNMYFIPCAHLHPSTPISDVQHCYCPLPCTFNNLWATYAFQRRSQWPQSLRRGSVVARLLGLRVRNPRAHGCLSLVNVASSWVEFSATGRSLIQRSPIPCVVCLSMIVTHP